MRHFWSLKIDCDASLKNAITTILGVDHNMEFVGWGLEEIIREEGPYVDYIEYFLDLLEGNYDKLALLGVERNDISIWLLYEYDEQCNMEFLSHNLKRMGENEIGLCVSCWQKR